MPRERLYFARCGDPIGVDFARWLKSELDARFGVPVRYVVYSHSHFDHAQGGRAFADTAVFVGHEKCGATWTDDSRRCRAT
ncbi:MAG TPA: MBL fold metallo-hydrolase [Gammaproteobacteria bacterium]|nr:MBL fold metallo-hydrolase [Gammaproteobacteria bacterium]